MADPVATMTVTGLAELEEALMELGNSVAGKALYNALMQAAIPIQDTAIAMAPQSTKPHFRYKRAKVKKISRTGNKALDAYNRSLAVSTARRMPVREIVQPGNLRKNIARKRLKGKKYSSVTGGEAYVGISWQGDAFYGRFLEFGTEEMAARPFLRPAFDARSGEALGIFMDRLRENIERARRRAAAKTQGTAR